MIALRCEKEPVRPDHMDYKVYMTVLRCEKNSIRLDHMD